MGFELFEKGSHIHGKLKDNEISIGKSTVSLAKNLGELFLKGGFIEVYLDREGKRVGLKPSKDSFKGFSVFKRNGNAGITGSWIKIIPKGKYKTFNEDGYVVFEVSEIAKKEYD